MKFSLIVTLTHPKWKGPIVHTDFAEAVSKAAYVKVLSVTSKQACELRNNDETQWEDPRGVLHHWKIEEEN